MTRVLHNSKHAEELSEAISRTLHSYNTGQHRCIEEFVHQFKSASDMMVLEVFPNAKEITESYAAFNAAARKLKYDLGDPHVTMVAVGDGHTPRTATLFAFRTNWQCISLDPGLNVNKMPLWESKIQRLHCIPKKVEDVNMEFGKVLIVAVHSHANLSNTLDHIRGDSRSLIAIPCCVDYSHAIEPDMEYRDAGIWSPKNLVKIWRNI